jgi:hypothetical protein
MEELQFITSFDDQPEQPIELVAYAFDRAGELIAATQVKEGRAFFKLDARQLRHARIFFAPAPEGREHKPTLEDMERLRAYEPVWEFNPEQRVYELLPIPHEIWKWWWLCRCRVRGRVVRPVSIGGITYELPVCNARVHICEVDAFPRWILRLPDDIIRRIRDELLIEVRRPWPPIPDPDPGPIFEIDPGVIDPSPIAIAQMNMPAAARIPGLRSKLDAVALNPQPLPPREPAMAHTHSAAEQLAFDPQPDPPGALALAELPLETRSALTSASTAIVREALASNAALLRPYLCLWPWLWHYYRCDELAVVYTNHQGRFDTTIYYPCFLDHPDLYFWVEYSIGGSWTTVYNPPIACNTYWNYACGSEVTIRISDVRVPWCDDPSPLPGRQLAVLAIGNNISTAEIQRAAAGAAEGLTTAGEPFGGSLEPHVWFGDGLIAAGVTHYRWSYRRLGSSSTPAALDHDVVRHYAEEASDGTLTFKPFPLGPDLAFVGQNLFKIQPEDPPTGNWAPQVDARENTASGFFLSHLLSGGNAALAAGKYELFLELFHADGTPVNFTDEGILVKEPTIAAPFGPNTVPTALAPAERLVLDSNGKVVAYRLVLHIDNNPCEGEIYDVDGSGLVLDPDCGFIQYAPGASVDFSFKARHPNDFAEFTFDTVRGSSNDVPAAQASGSVAASPINGFTRNSSGVYSKNGVLVTSLLGDCDKGAFAETLSVRALANDGWSRLSYLDRYPAAKAFALEPQA